MQNQSHRTGYREATGIAILPRDAMRSTDYAIARCLSVRLSVRLSVSQSICLSVTRRYSVETAQHVIKLFSLLSSHTILVFALYQPLWQYFDGDFPNGGVKCKGRGMKKIQIFDQNLHISQKQYRIRP